MYGQVYGRFESYYDPANTTTAHIFKCHGASPLILKADKILVSIRDPLDIAGSMVRCKMAAPTEASIRKLLTNSIQGTLTYLSVADHVMRYELMHADKLAQLHQIALTLGYDQIGTAQRAIHNELERLGNARGPKANDTYMGAPHVTNGDVGSYKATLSPALVDFVLREFGGIRKRLGYA
jgi:hypothetical protein